MEKESGLPRLPERKPRKPVVYPGMSFEEVLNTIEKECGGPLAVKSYGRGKHKVIILPEAVNEFRVMVSFGRRSPKNRKEQKYNGYGHFLDGGDGNVIIVVSHFIEVLTMNRSAVHASNLGPGGEPNPGLDFLEYYREEFLSSEKMQPAVRQTRFWISADLRNLSLKGTHILIWVYSGLSRTGKPERLVPLPPLSVSLSVIRSGARSLAVLEKHSKKRK